MLEAYPQAGQNVVHRSHGSQEHRQETITEHEVPFIQSAMDLELALAHTICHRTGGRIRLLEVQILGSRIILRGWASSYHVVQIALAGLWESLNAMGLDRPDEVELDIDVVPAGTARGFDANSLRPR